MSWTLFLARWAVFDAFILAYNRGWDTRDMVAVNGFLLFIALAYKITEEKA